MRGYIAQKRLWWIHVSDTVLIESIPDAILLESIFKTYRYAPSLAILHLNIPKQEEKHLTYQQLRKLPFKSINMSVCYVILIINTLSLHICQGLTFAISLK
jgi:uncharacterized membrane protein